MFLDTENFKFIVKNTPLVSIDLIVQSNDDQFLLGKRTNRPARGFWFVPGGRVQKDETLDDAFIRLTRNELGIEIHRDVASFMGVYEHMYSDNFSEDNFTTHYIVIAYKIVVDSNDISYPLEQHSSYTWMHRTDILSGSNIHYNTLAYFYDIERDG